MKKALIIGNSDGIGLGLTRRLLDLGWQVAGISRAPSSLSHPTYAHHLCDVRDESYPQKLKDILSEFGLLDLCVYCAGIGELLDFANMEREVQTFEVNLMGLIKTVTTILPGMVESDSGHFIGLSSVADAMISAEAPSYHASKAAFSNYLEGLTLALEKSHAAVTNVRFGFVDTKMAKGDVKPFMMSVDRAVDHLMTCIRKRPAVYTAPRFINPLINLRGRMLKIRLSRCVQS